MKTLLDKECDPSQLSPLTLAFIGDTVYDLFIKEGLVKEANRPVNKLHMKASEIARASSQAKAAQKIIPILSEKELGILKRGRNAHVNHLPKHSNQRDYHYATALEALFGYLYLSGDFSRLEELFDIIMNGENQNEEER